MKDIKEKEDLKIIKNMKNVMIVVKDIKSSSRNEVTKLKYLNRKAESMLKSLDKKAKQEENFKESAIKIFEESGTSFSRKTLDEFISKLQEVPIVNQQQVLLIAASLDLKMGTNILKEICSLLNLER